MMKLPNTRTFSFALAALALAAVLASACSSPVIPLTNNDSASPAAPTPAVPSVSAADQTLDGDQVTIADVVSQGQGWIAIHTDENGSYGPPIGFAPVNNGDNQNVVVKIDTSQMTPVLYAMLHIDGGQVGTYEFPGPDVPVIINEEHIAPPFKVSEQAAQAGPASLVIGDQDVANGKVVVAEVVSAGPGWVAIHAEGAGGQPGASIGFTRVSAGANKDVTVLVDESKVTARMYAVLYKDEGEAGTYEFPGPDGPQQVDGQDVAQVFQASGAAVAAAPDQATETQAAPEATATGEATVEATAEMGHDMGSQETPTADAAGDAEFSGGTAGDGPGAILPEITVADQTMVKETLTVPYVFSLGDAWLVLHYQNPDGTMGNMVGAAQVEDGENVNVVVPVNTGLVTPTIYAMLHFDKGVSGSLEFPGPDGPVLIRGDVLAPSFHVTAGADEEVIVDASKEEGRVPHLVNGEGLTLYLSLDDPPGQSNCTDACLETWKPLLAGLKVTAGVGVEQSKLGVIALPDGSRQVTYSGAPLYTYVDDKKPGDTNGQGVDGIWFLVSP